MFPDEYVPEFRAAVSKLAPYLNKLTITLLKCMALGLGTQTTCLWITTFILEAFLIDLEENFFSSHHRFMFQGAEKNRTIFRSLYYPKLSDEDIEPGVIRCGAHSDYGSITLLFQDSMGGLEVNVLILH